MIDMNNPSPLIMTHYELIAFIAAAVAVVATMASDWWRARSKSRPAQKDD
jgi:hypothetical protein